MRVHQDGLRIGITDHADTLITSERVKFILKLRTEIVALQVVNLTTEAFLLVEGHQTRTTGAEVRVVVCTVEQVVYTAFC